MSALPSLTGCVTCLIWADFHWVFYLILSVSSQQCIQYLLLLLEGICWRLLCTNSMTGMAPSCPKKRLADTTKQCIWGKKLFLSVFIFIPPPHPRHHAPARRRPPPPTPTPPPPPRHFFLSSLALILCPVSAFLLLSSRSIAPFRPIESTSTTVKCTLCTEHSTVRCVLHCTLYTLLCVYTVYTVYTIRLLPFAPVQQCAHCTQCTAQAQFIKIKSLTQYCIVQCIVHCALCSAMR